MIWPAQSEQQEAPARILMPTMRAISREAFQAGFYEAQDVLAEVDRVDLLELQAGRAFPVRDRWQRRLLHRHMAPGLAYANPGLKKVRLSHDYDLFIATCNNAWDLMYVNAIEGWQERCRVSVCWLDELWITDIPQRRDLLRTLRRFDHVFLNTLATAGPLSDFLGRPCHPLPTATDALTFSPLPSPPQRVIDVYSIGRRWDGVHQALLRAASESGLFYIHDSFRAMAKMEPIDFKQHRRLYANMAKRSRYFIVSPAKMNQPQETRGQVEIGYRYFEGAAAGAVLVGQAPDCEPFRRLFPWPDAVIEVRPDGSDVIDVLADLDADPERLAAISRRNAAESLLRHDWIHRWQTIFNHAGIALSPAMTARAKRLQALAGAALTGSATEVESDQRTDHRSARQR
ncbi:MAG TPA: glycosyltransferase [Hyphomicrobiaceae bacterium]|nr:glycosyltransferase [Hyphomicrobiaceae bacterium]